jgi:hypothetical protein
MIGGTKLHPYCLNRSPYHNCPNYLASPLEVFFSDRFQDFGYLS